MALSLPDSSSEDDRYTGPRLGESKAEILTAAGAHDQAIDQIERVLATRYIIALTVWDLRLNPLWDPLREHPRFLALVGRADAED